MRITRRNTQKERQMQSHRLRDPVLILTPQEHRHRDREPARYGLKKDDMPRLPDDIRRDHIHRPGPERLLVKRFRKIRKEIRKHQRADKPAQPTRGRAADVQPRRALALQRRDREPHRIPRVELCADEVDDHEADGERDALQQPREAGGHVGCAAGDGETEETAGGEEEAAVEGFDEGYEEGFVDVVEAGLKVSRVASEGLRAPEEAEEEGSDMVAGCAVYEVIVDGTETGG